VAGHQEHTPEYQQQRKSGLFPSSARHNLAGVEQKKNYDKAAQLRPGPERDALRQQAVASPRVFVGRSTDRAATVTLSDANGRPRLRMSVDAGGEAKVEFLDVDGKIIASLPASRGSVKKR
jgi:hypothetical protein